MKTFVTNSANETKKLGKILAGELKDGSASRRTIALQGELGSGKTTFAQGLLKGLGAKGPFTSPTFLVIKNYKPKAKSQKLKAVYHIDAYRVSAKDILALGWEEIIGEKNAIIIIEWADRVRKIIRVVSRLRAIAATSFSADFAPIRSRPSRSALVRR